MKRLKKLSSDYMKPCQICDLPTDNPERICLDCKKDLENNTIDPNRDKYKQPTKPKH